MNMDLFKIACIRKDKSMQDVADILHISLVSVYKKLKNNKFTIEEAMKISNMLELDKTERADIFLPDD